MQSWSCGCSSKRVSSGRRCLAPRSCGGSSAKGDPRPKHSYCRTSAFSPKCSHRLTSVQRGPAAFSSRASQHEALYTRTFRPTSVFCVCYHIRCQVVACGLELDDPAPRHLECCQGRAKDLSLRRSMAKLGFAVPRSAGSSLRPLSDALSDAALRGASHLQDQPCLAKTHSTRLTRVNFTGAGALLLGRCKSALCWAWLFLMQPYAAWLFLLLPLQSAGQGQLLLHLHAFVDKFFKVS